MKKVVIIGGGAAGFFAAMRNKSLYPENEVIILEKQENVLSKVKVSGGGRCNVTHACFEPNELVKFYPRGNKELRSVFARFHASHTVHWFEERGIALKIEEDGRMFPTTNDSQTIIDTFLQETRQLAIKIHTQTVVKEIIKTENEGFEIITNHTTYQADALMIAAGSSPQMWGMLQNLGHEIVKPVPSLFTFKIKDARLTDLLGVSLPLVQAQIVGTKIEQTGAFLITHWGLSGPAILRTSAWGARVLAEKNYQFQLKINFLPQYTTESLMSYFLSEKNKWAKKQIAANALFDIPARLWKRLVAAAEIAETLTWAEINKTKLQQLANQLTAAVFEVNGKSTFKEEFVTCGGVALKQVNLKTMESKLVPNLYFGGETLDIDAITGGFNFQAAWSTGWIAGENL